MKQSKIYESLPYVFLMGWTALVGALVWAKLSGAIEPPAWDSLSYVKKAMLFWQSVAQGQFTNPFDLEPTLRPPGTILVSYPFGFDADFRGFYFRASFIPFCLFIVAVLIAAQGAVQTVSQKWRVALLAVILGGTPTLYQFQPNDDVPWDVTWGMVDSFLASLAAISAACVIKSVRQSSFRWLIFAAIAASLCFLVKPSGLIVMAIVGASWIALLLAENINNLKAPAVLLQRGIAFGVALYALVLYASFGTQYFSAENISFGNRVVALLADETNQALTWLQIVGLLQVGFGFSVLSAIVLGLFLAGRHNGHLAAGVCAVVALVIGIWFWWFATEPWEPRYGLPFVAMAFIFLVPIMIAESPGVLAKLSQTALVVFTLPSALVVVALATPAAPPLLQKILGINLAIDVYSAERAQAEELRKLISGNSTRIYAFDISSRHRSFQSAFEYGMLTTSEWPSVTFVTPVDWQRPSTFRRDDITRANFIVFEPIADLDRRMQLLQTVEVPDFYTETAIFRSWATNLTESDGIAVVSNAGLRVLRVDRRELLAQSFEKLAVAHEWSKAFRTANAAEWYADSDMDEIRAKGGLILEDVLFRPLQSDEEVLIVKSATRIADNPLELAFWIHAGEANLVTPWTLFCHIIDPAGTIIGNAQIEVPAIDQKPQDKSIRRLVLSFPNQIGPQDRLAFGFFQAGKPDLRFMATTDPLNDWDGRRRIIELPK